MAWIGTSQGVFRLHESDQYCGSFLTVDDAAEILEVLTQALHALPTRTIDGKIMIDELVLHKSWGSGEIPSPQKPRAGNAKRSFDELILRKLLQITLPNCQVECQVPFGKKHVDLSFTQDGKRVFVEFVGPSHFIKDQREPTSPRARQKEVEDHFGCECIVWPFWIQRCSINIRAIINKKINGLASVWSTEALFGDFFFPKSAQIIIELSEQFRAIRPEGIGYMYGDSHTKKPIHPIVDAIRNGKKSKSRLIPRGNDKSDDFWIPKEIR